jgi:hypothetical protein
MQTKKKTIVRLSWSGVIVRNFEIRCFFKVALAAGVFAFFLGAEDLFAQGGRFAFSPQKNARTNNRQNSEQNQPAPVQPPPVNTFSEDQFRTILNQAIEVTSKRYLTANAHSPWQIFHSILALHETCQLRLGNEKVNAIEWLSTAEPQFNKQPWMFLTPHGAKFQPYNNILYHFEGHPGQFLALLSESNLPLDHEFKVEGKVVTLNDVVNNTMKEVNSREEVTWVLWALQHHLKPDAVWVNQANETWSIEKLVQMETAHPVVGAPCGGNHRLFALTRARDKYLKTGERLRGVWLEADQKIKKHIEIARSLQNRDGSFSGDWYRGPQHTSDLNQRFNTTGHTMEFLAISLPDARLNEPWVRNAVWMLANELIYYKNNEITAGPLFHTLDALILYRNRIRSKTPAETPDPSKPAPQIANQLPTIPLGTTLKNAPILKAVPDKTKMNLDKSGLKPGSDESDSNSITLPDKEALLVPETNPVEVRSNLVKPSVPAAANPKPETAASRANVHKSSPKIDPSQLADVGEPAPTPDSKPGKLPPLRVTKRDPLRNAAPALLPETYARPLLIPDAGADALKQPVKSSTVNPNQPAWRPTAPDPKDSDAIPIPPEMNDSERLGRPTETASALTPSNL